MRFKNHICERDDQCEICKEYVNQLDKERRSNKGGSFQNRVNSTMVRKPSASMGKGKHQRVFELPKPVLARPSNYNMS